MVFVEVCSSLTLYGTPFSAVDCPDSTTTVTVTYPATTYTVSP